MLSRETFHDRIFDGAELWFFPIARLWHWQELTGKWRAFGKIFSLRTDLHFKTPLFVRTVFTSLPLSLPHPFVGTQGLQQSGIKHPSLQSSAQLSSLKPLSSAERRASVCTNVWHPFPAPCSGLRKAFSILWAIKVYFPFTSRGTFLRSWKPSNGVRDMHPRRPRSVFLTLIFHISKTDSASPAFMIPSCRLPAD